MIRYVESVLQNVRQNRWSSNVVLGKTINYKELPIQKRIQIDQNIVAKKRKIIDKISKKILRQLKQKGVKELKRTRWNADAVGD